MAKDFFIFLLLIISTIKSNKTNNSFNVIKLQDLTRIKFNLNNEFIVFEYYNNIHKLFDSSIFFIFDNGQRASTKVYIYDSLDKIKREESGFINYLYETSLKQTKYFKISHDDTFYKDKSTYYIVLYDISSTYIDYIFVVNSLNYLPLEKEISYKMTLDIQLPFNFIIQKNHSTYLHYQGRGINTILYEYAYYFRIKSENGETFIDEQSSGTSGYVKLEPNKKYYAQILIVKSSSETEFMLNFEKYKEIHLLEGDKEITVRALYAQHFSFFKDISNMAINETIKVSIHIDISGFHTDNIFYKVYDSSNFENLLNIFPSKREDFDSQLGSLNMGGNFNFEIIKTSNSQKGALIGIYVDDPGFYWKIEPTSIQIKTIKKKEDEKEEPRKIDSLDNEKSSSSGVIAGVIVSVIVIIIFYLCCYLYCKKRERNGDDRCIIVAIISSN